MNDEKLANWLNQAGFNASTSLQARINQTLANATTPLMHASRLGNIEVINVLLRLGANPALLNADGNGALWFACFADSVVCAQTLITAGAPLDSQNINGATALIYCASAGKIPLVKLLLTAGANSGLMTLDDFTALELASNRECLQLLKGTRSTFHA